MKNQRGAASIVGMLLTMVVLAFGIWFLLKSSGMLSGGSGEGEESAIDQAVVAAAQVELGQVKRGLEMARTLGTDRAYPSTAAVTSLDALRRAMPAGLVLADSTSLHFDFSSYAAPSADQYLLRVFVRNQARTLLEVGPGFGPRRVEPQ